MATTTPYLSLSILGIGESVGTWGIPLNSNFQKIDALAGEVISARGSSANLGDRIANMQTEITTARGTFTNLNDRLSVLLLPNGTLNVGNFNKATGSALGIARLSATAVTPADPIVVGDNDPRMLSLSEKNGLTGGASTALHRHFLSGIEDVTATAAEVNQVTDGVNPTVTAANLNVLTGGGTVPKTLMTIPNATYNYTGIVSLSATPALAGSPIAVGDNDPRMLTGIQHDELVGGASTSLHKHNLVDGAADLTVTAAQLNQLTGLGPNVTASNLDALTGSGSTGLHNHDARYYTKTEHDATSTSLLGQISTSIGAHNASATAHQGADLQLGDLTVESIGSASPGVSSIIRAHATDAIGAVKWQILDKSGIAKLYATENGELHADKIVTRLHQVIETTTMSQDAVLTSNLTVNGNTILGDNPATDTLIVNTSNSTFNGDITIAGGNGLTVTGTINGVDIVDTRADVDALQIAMTAAQSSMATANTNIANLQSGSTSTNASVTSVSNEVTTARGGETNLNARLGAMSAATTAVNSALTTFANRNDNPHTVTLTQAIASDGGTDITAAQLELLSDGSNADALHTHSKYDVEITAARNSALLGSFASIDARLEAVENTFNGVKVEVENARGASASVDARIDLIDGQISSHTSTLSGLSASVSALTSEVTTARNASASLDDRLDAVDTAVSQKATTYEYTGASAATHVVTHGLGKQYVNYTIWDTGTNTAIISGITSVTADSSSQLTIVLGSAKAVKVRVTA